MLSLSPDARCFKYPTVWWVYLTLGAKGLISVSLSFIYTFMENETIKIFVTKTNLNFEFSLANIVTQKLFVLLIMFPTQDHKTLWTFTIPITIIHTWNKEQLIKSSTNANKAFMELSPPAWISTSFFCNSRCFSSAANLRLSSFRWRNFSRSSFCCSIFLRYSRVSSSSSSSGYQQETKSWNLHLTIFLSQVHNETTAERPPYPNLKDYYLFLYTFLTRYWCWHSFLDKIISRHLILTQKHSLNSILQLS